LKKSQKSFEKKNIFQKSFEGKKNSSKAAVYTNIMI
jgi:hypothetical protein